MKTDQQLAEIYQNAASSASQKLGGDTAIVPWNLLSDEVKDSRVEGMRLVREAVENSINENSTWRAAALLWETRFIEKRNEFAKQAEEIARLTAELSNKKARITALDKLYAECSEECDRLRWRSVEVRPTREDADSLGFVIGLFDDGGTARQSWDVPFLATCTHWRPFCPPPAPTAAEVERPKFDKWWKQENPNEGFTCGEQAAAWSAWQARALEKVLTPDPAS